MTRKPYKLPELPRYYLTHQGAVKALRLEQKRSPGKDLMVIRFKQGFYSLSEYGNRYPDEFGTSEKVLLKGRWPQRCGV